jgi:hypothetical protein
MTVGALLGRRGGCCALIARASNRHTVAIELMILVIAVLTGAQISEVVHELDLRAINLTIPGIRALVRSLQLDVANGTSFICGTRASPLAPAALPGFSSSSRNGFMMSIGIGKTTVEFCSAPISVRVCR